MICSNTLPAAIDLTVPRLPSRRRQGLRLHTNQISQEEIAYFEGLPVTAVARTIADVAREGLAESWWNRQCRKTAPGLAQPDDLRSAAALGRA